MIVHLEPLGKVSDHQFEKICRANPDLMFERTAEGGLVIVPPVGGEGARWESDIGTALGLWNRQHRLGVVFSSQILFALPSGARRGPDASWVARDRWTALSPEERRGYPPLAPDFVVEIRSPSDRLGDVAEKMREYMEAGTRLGWLLDPIAGIAHICRGLDSPERRPLSEPLSGETVLPGFTYYWMAEPDDTERG